MRRTILGSAVFLMAGGLLSAGQVNLEGLDMKTLSGDLSGIEVPVPASRPGLSWAAEAAVSLNGDLAERRIKASIRIVTAHGENELEVNFLSLKDYEKIKDLFYQDPGDGPNYMDVKIRPLVLGEPVKPSARAKSFDGASACYQEALRYVSPPPSAAKLCQGAVDTAPVDCYRGACQEQGVGASVAFSICIHSPSFNPAGPLDCFRSLKPSLGDSTAAVLCRGSADAAESLACYSRLLSENVNPGDAAVMCSR